MRFEILKISEVAPEIFDFSKVALAGFEFDTPGLVPIEPIVCRTTLRHV